MQKFILFDFDGVIADSFDLAFSVSQMICPDLPVDGYKKRFEGNINDWIDSVNVHNENCRHDVDFFTELLIIISSTITSPISEFVKKYDLEKYFKEILGNDIHHSKVEKIKMVFEKYATSADQCVFVTDTLGDMLEAEKTGVGAIGVSWGFHSHETLRKGNPFKIVDKPEDLSVAISDYFLK
jgi:phosphoglycolate phosphatase